MIAKSCNVHGLGDRHRTRESFPLREDLLGVIADEVGEARQRGRYGLGDRHPGALRGGFGLASGWSTMDDRTQIPVRSNSALDRKSTRLNSSHVSISYAVF